MQRYPRDVLEIGCSKFLTTVLCSKLLWEKYLTHELLQHDTVKPPKGHSSFLPLTRVTAFHFSESCEQWSENSQHLYKQKFWVRCICATACAFICSTNSPPSSSRRRIGSKLKREFPLIRLVNQASKEAKKLGFPVCLFPPPRTTKQVGIFNQQVELRPKKCYYLSIWEYIKKSYLENVLFKLQKQVFKC